FITMKARQARFPNSKIVLAGPCGKRWPLNGSEMNDRRRSKRVAGLRLTLCDRRVSNEGYYDKLQTDQGTGRRPDDYVEVLPCGEYCHAVTPSLVRPREVLKPLTCSALPIRSNRTRHQYPARWHFSSENCDAKLAFPCFFSLTLLKWPLIEK